MNVDKQTRTDQWSKAGNVIENVFQCDFREVAYSKSHVVVHGKHLGRSTSLFLLNVCNRTEKIQNNSIDCFDGHFFHEVCCRSRLQIMKVTRVSMVHALTLTLPLHTKLIYLQGDPRTIYGSRTQERWCHKDQCLNFAALCNQRREDLLTLKKLQNKQVTIIRFEDLASNPMKETQHFFRELGLNHTKTTEGFLKKHTMGHTVKKGQERWRTTRNSSTTVSRWKQSLGRSKILEMQNICMDVIKELGYEIIK